jgi:hypothetical protein
VWQTKEYKSSSDEIGIDLMGLRPKPYFILFPAKKNEARKGQTKPRLPKKAHVTAGRDTQRSLQHSHSHRLYVLSGPARGALNDALLYSSVIALIGSYDQKQSARTGISLLQRPYMALCALNVVCFNEHQQVQWQRANVVQSLPRALAGPRMVRKTGLHSLG